MKLKAHNRKAFRLARGYLEGVGLIILATLFGYLAQSFLDPFNSALLYLSCDVLTAILWGFGPSVLVCFLSILAHELLYIVTFQNFGLPDLDNVPTLIMLLLAGLVVSYLAAQVRAQTGKAERRELETRTLYALSRNLAGTDDLDASVRFILRTAKEVFGYDMSIFLPQDGDEQRLRIYGEDAKLALGDNVINVVQWTRQHQTGAGQGTGAFPDAGAYFLPLLTVRGAVGVIAVLPGDASNRLTPERLPFLNAFADLAAVAIERITFAEEARNMKISQAATEKLQTAFLDSISHDLRTPLATIIGALGSLKEEVELDSYAQMSLIDVANQDAEKLNHLITNLLDLSRIQAGTIRISRKPCFIYEIVSVALDHLNEQLGQRKITVDLSPELPFVNADFGLFTKVLYNVLDNAFKYSPSDAPIEIKARPAGDTVVIEVADRGIGIPPQDLPYIFERFYRVPNSNVPGTGLGLSICKGIVEAHGGGITAENRVGGGIVVRITVPAMVNIIADREQ